MKVVKSYKAIAGTISFMFYDCLISEYEQESLVTVGNKGGEFRIEHAKK